MSLDQSIGHSSEAEDKTKQKNGFDSDSDGGSLQSATQILLRFIQSLTVTATVTRELIFNIKRMRAPCKFPVNDHIISAQLPGHECRRLRAPSNDYHDPRLGTV
jgi:hypothetical protein